VIANATQTANMFDNAKINKIGICVQLTSQFAQAYLVSGLSLHKCA